MRKVGTHPEPPRHIFSHLSHIPTAMIRGLLHKKLLAAASTRLARVLFFSPLTSPLSCFSFGMWNNSQWWEDGFAFKNILICRVDETDPSLLIRCKGENIWILNPLRMYISTFTPLLLQLNWWANHHSSKLLRIYKDFSAYYTSIPIIM